MGQLDRLLTLHTFAPPPPPKPNGFLAKTFNKFPISRLQFPTISSSILSHSIRNFGDQTNKSTVLKIPISPRFSHVCNMSKDSDMISQLELGKPDGKPDKRVNGIFWILLINLGVFAADHWFHIREIKGLYLYHSLPVWYQFVTSTFCHANWKHLSSNLFFLYIFGKLVEEEEGNFALWTSYILTGLGANLVSWLVLPRNAVSLGASGAVFGLFAISVLVKMCWDWRKILEVLILGQFVIEKVMEAAQASTRMSGASSAMQSVNHIAHLSGALVGAGLVWLLSRVPSEPSDQDVSKLSDKTNRKT
ncbi:rhomboid-like protein 11, chloroplastic [Papaver somniferum]|uniref:rhomboid-like protein 11, chloroplastic n=1 Tax=Papaver somniferum TaxID=3469 RepID=UPI000E6F52C2|nr:rhomboid-like protein 11, chloroplastic [Papaver somniferum]